MSDKWTGRQKGDAEFKPPTPKEPPPEPKPGTITKSTIDKWIEDYRPLLDGPARRYNPWRDLDYRQSYRPNWETASDKRKSRRDWERNGGEFREREQRDIDFAVEQERRLKYEMMLRYSEPLLKSPKVIAQRIIIHDAKGQACLQLDVPNEKQTKLAELFDKAAQVPGYMHWWAESEPERVKQVIEASREIVGALRYDADYWKPAYPDVYDFACFIAQGIVSCEASKIRVETIRERGGDLPNWLLGGIVS